jgi:hypothetical protein
VAVPLYEFVCAGGHVTERLASFSCEATVCFTCNQQANRVQVNRIMPRIAAPKGERVAHYMEAAQEAMHAHDSTDDPVAKAQTRPDIHRPAYYRAMEKTLIGDDRWTEPRPHESDREVRAL